MPTYTHPDTLRPTDEAPYPINTELPLWSENYCSQAYDPNTRVGVWLHMGRTHYKSDLWREVAVIYLPDGDFVVVKGYGRNQHDRGPGSATMRFAYEEPWNTWTKTLDGAGVHVPAGTAWNGLVPDGLHIPVSFELSFAGLHPAWDVGAEMKQQTWGHSHYEQVCAVTGTIRWGDQEIALDGTGIRDHTQGPRNYTTVHRHCWLHGAFPSGKGFILLDVDVEGHRMSRAATFTPTATRDAEVIETPMLGDHTEHSDPYRLVLRDDDGEEAVITAEQVHVMPYGFIGESEVTLGYQPDAVSHQFYEAHTRFQWDGETGYGLTERSVRVTR